MVKHHKNKKLNKLVLVIVLILAVSGVLFLILRDKDTPVTDISDVAPATEQEKTQNDIHKEEIVKEEVPAKDEEENSNNPSSSKTVSVIITQLVQDTDAEAVEARGYANTFESSGTCTLTLTKGSSSATSERDAVQNASSMSCGALKIARSRLSAGIWNATLSYKSSSVSGEVSTTIEVD